MFDDFTPTMHGKLVSFGRLNNTTEEELLRKAREIQPDLDKLENISNRAYFYVLGALMAKPKKGENK